MKPVGLILFLLIAASINAADNPEITVIGKSKIDFRTYPAKERKEAFFKIKNKGTGTLKIIKIRKTCGCAEAKMDKMELKPEEVGTLKAVVYKDSIYGSYSKNVYVQSNDPKQRFLTLNISGKAIPILKVKPKENIYAGILPAGKEWTQEFLLEATEDGVEIGEVVVSGNLPAKTEITKKSDMQFFLKVTITPDIKVPIFKIQIKVPVSKPEGWKGVEIQIMGKVQ